jgi:transcriptional regulator with XRE-family HTH domain
VTQDIRQAFGDNLRKIRKEKGLTQEELAFQCELDRSYISLVERGKLSISIVTMKKMADVLGIKVRDLIPEEF